jgi:AcrR family transcriptional regulator
MIQNNNTTRRARVHQATRAEILDTARRQIATTGAAALSLRAIAAEMQMTAPALYRYFKSRDELVTALIVAAYHSFADTLEAARDAVPASDHKQRLDAIGMAYRQWALAHPQDYFLIFGAPVPNYQPPEEPFDVEGNRSFAVLVGVLDDAWQAGALQLPKRYTQPGSKLQSQLNFWKSAFGVQAKTPIVHLALVIWARVHGLVSLEIARQMGACPGDDEEMYRIELLELGQQLGLDKSTTGRNK